MKIIPFQIGISNDFHRSFESLSCQMLHEGYALMFAAKQYQLDYEEEKLTAQYIDFMESTEVHKTFTVTIFPERRLYSKKHTHGEESPKKAPRIDIQFTWNSKQHFWVEAKILFEKDKKGNKGPAKEKYNRYIETGIDHFQTGYYPMPGCMVGYVVEGDVVNIIDSINAIIAASNKGEITRSPSSDFSEMHLSSISTENGVIALRHFMLKL